MFIPLYDYNALRSIKTPVVTRTLIVITVLVFLVFESGLVVDAQLASVGAFGVIPAEFHLGAGLRSELAVIPEPLTFITYVFLHGGWMHLIGNMLFLWVFGDNVEDRWGHIKFFVIYIICGIAASLTHIFFNLNSSLPSLGASGAISGILGAYLVLFPK